MSKKITFLFLVIFLGIFAFPFAAVNAGTYQADGKTITYEGLVPCGKSEPGPGESPEVTIACQLCHFFVMFKGVLDFVLKMVFVIAVLMFVVGGFMFLLAGQNPSMLGQAKSIMTSVVWGLVIIFAAWIVVNTIFIFIGVADWTGLREGWFTIDCPIQLPSSPSATVPSFPSLQQLNPNLQLFAADQLLHFINVNPLLENEEFPQPDF